MRSTIYEGGMRINLRKAFLVVLVALNMLGIILIVNTAFAEPMDQTMQQINETQATDKYAPDYRSLPSPDTTIPFRFRPWGTYSGYIEDGQKYYQRYISPGSMGCMSNSGSIPGLYPSWVSAVLIDSDIPQTISSDMPLELGEGYELEVKSVDIDGNKLYLQLLKDSVVVNSMVLRIVENPTKRCDNTYTYHSTIETLQDSFFDYTVVLAVHFKNIFPGADGRMYATVDGVWQVSETGQWLCTSDLCPVGAMCHEGLCICPTSQVDCENKCIPRDDNNCISCGYGCTDGRQCDTINGVCICPTGIIRYVGYNGLPENYNSIQEAIDNANDCDLIKVAVGHYEENLKIQKSLAIVGADKYLTIIDGIGTHGTLITIAKDPNQPDQNQVIVTLADMTIQNADASGGNAGGIGISSFADVTVKNCIITADVTVKDCIITENYANWGGGIYINGHQATLKVVGCDIVSNSAYYDGGGILNRADVTLIGSRINNNQATNGHGGGISDGGKLKMRNSIISGNTANGQGGGIDWWNNANKPEIEDSQISGNSPDDIFPPI